MLLTAFALQHSVMARRWFKERWTQIIPWAIEGLAHLVFALATTAYIVLAIQFEERDLLSEHGAQYAEYRRKVSMLLPGIRRPAPPLQVTSTSAAPAAPSGSRH